MSDAVFRLRLNFQKLGRLRYLSHLEVTRALERTVRRAQLPYAISQGFNAHMRFAPGPALPVGSEGLDEYFDVMLAEYVRPDDALARLRAASARDLPVRAVFYVDPREKGLQATHIHEEYRIVLASSDLAAGDILSRLRKFIEGKELTVSRKGAAKVYDLSQAVEGFTVEGLEERGHCAVSLRLKATEQGSIRPEILIRAALGEGSDWEIQRITRTRLTE